MQGTVKGIVEDRGFGFITAPGEKKDIFFHISEIKDDSIDFDSSIKGRRVEFDLTEGTKGPQASNIRGL